jgi:hypothetical protein
LAFAQSTASRYCEKHERRYAVEDALERVALEFRGDVRVGYRFEHRFRVFLAEPVSTLRRSGEGQHLAILSKKLAQFRNFFPARSCFDLGFDVVSQPHEQECGAAINGFRPNNSAPCRSTVSRSVQGSIEQSGCKSFHKWVRAMQIDLSGLNRQLETRCQACGVTWNRQRITNGAGDILKTDLDALPNARSGFSDGRLVMAQCSSAEIPDVNAGADGGPDGIYLLRNFGEFDRLLGEHRARTGFPVGSILPLCLNLPSWAVGWLGFAAAEFQQHLTVVFGALMEQNIFEYGLHELLSSGRDWHGNSKRTAYGFVFSEENPQDDTVDACVFPVIRDHTNLRAWLPIAVNATFTLLVASRIPRQIVVEDRVEVLLQVDAFAEAIGGDKYSARKCAECSDAFFTFSRSELPGYTGDFGALRDLVAGTNSRGDVLRSLDEAAKDNRLVTVFQKRRNDADRPGELGIRFAFQAVGDSRHLL